MVLEYLIQVMKYWHINKSVALYFTNHFYFREFVLTASILLLRKHIDYVVIIDIKDMEGE